MTTLYHGSYIAVNHQVCIRNQEIINQYYTIKHSNKNMRDTVLWRKQSRIVMLLAEALSVDPEEALDIYYSTKICQQLADPNSGLQLMSDQYILQDLLTELQK